MVNCKCAFVNLTNNDEDVVVGDGETCDRAIDVSYSVVLVEQDHVLHGPFADRLVK